MANLTPFPISDLLQMRSQSAATGVLSIDMGEKTAEIYLTQGRLMHARCGDYVGEGAMHLLLKQGSAPCEWREGITSNQSTLFKTVEAILVDHAFIVDLSQDEILRRFDRDFQPEGEMDKKVLPLSVVVSGAGLETFRFDLELPKIIVGRQSELCNIVIPDESVSSEHGVFFVHGRVILYHDLGSTNGSWINGEMISETVVDVGQRIHLGLVALDVVDFSAMQDAPAEEKTTQLDPYLNIPEKALEKVSEGMISVETKKKLRSTSKIQIDSSKLQ